MDFNDTPEEAAFRAEARAWLEKNAELRGDARGHSSMSEERLDDDAIRAAQAWQKKKAEAGWACITWPKAYGGRGGTPIQSVIWNQEEARVRTPPPVHAIGLGMCGPTIMTHGNEEQKKKWIPKMVTGEEIWCQLFSEPAGGSDLAGLRMKAVRDGDDWVVNGQKIWTTGAQFCEWGIVVTRHDENLDKYSGLTYFVVDMRSPGIEVRPIVQMNGGRGFNEVFFTDVRIPDAYRLGAIGEGWKVALTTLMNERASIGGGGGTDSIRQLFRLARETSLDGRRAIDDSAVRQRLAEFYVRAQGLKFTGYRTLSALSQGRIPGPEASMGKLVGAKLTQDMGNFGIELAGLAGMVMEPDFGPTGSLFHEIYLGIPGLRIAGGTDEVMRNIIAERVLGLPPEMRVDKKIAFKEIPTGPK
jgi:alkylation response protein AidB-like acyl-CoA dehydrogenase